MLTVPLLHGFPHGMEDLLASVDCCRTCVAAVDLDLHGCVHEVARAQCLFRSAEGGAVWAIRPNRLNLRDSSQNVLGSDVAEWRGEA